MREAASDFSFSVSRFFIYKEGNADTIRERERGLSVPINLHMEIRVILGAILFNCDVLFFN